LLKAEEQHDEVSEIIMTLLGVVPTVAKPDEIATEEKTTQQDAQIPSEQPSYVSAPTVPVPSGAAIQTSITQQPVTFQTPTGEVIPPVVNASLSQPQNSTGVFNTPAPTASSQNVDSTPPADQSVTGNGAMMQPANAYNFSGIPASARPLNYVSPQTRQEEVE